MKDRIQSTYIVQQRVNKKIMSHTLRRWCEMKGMSYNTVIARIWRAGVNRDPGVIYFKSTDKIISPKNFRDGKPPNNGTSPLKKLKDKDVGTEEPQVKSKNKHRKKS